MHAAASDVIRRSYDAQAQRALHVAQASQRERQATRGEDGDDDEPRRLSATRGMPFDFKLHVYRREQNDAGDPVVREVGPHGRSIFWVPQRQTVGRLQPDSDDTLASRG